MYQLEQNLKSIDLLTDELDMSTSNQTITLIVPCR